MPSFFFFLPLCLTNINSSNRAHNFTKPLNFKLLLCHWDIKLRENVTCRSLTDWTEYLAASNSDVLLFLFHSYSGLGCNPNSQSERKNGSVLTNHSAGGGIHRNMGTDVNNRSRIQDCDWVTLMSHAKHGGFRLASFALMVKHTEL